MRQRILWAIVVLAVLLIGIALMRFNMTALHEPGRAETRLAKQALKEAVHTTDSIAGYVMPTMAGHNERRGSGCIHAHPISQASKCRATPTRSCIGSSRMESASPECRLSVTLRPRITFGIS